VELTMRRTDDVRRIVLTPRGRSWPVRWERLEQALDRFGGGDEVTPPEEGRRPDEAAR
jgi:hypothetical protein